MGKRYIVNNGLKKTYLESWLCLNPEYLRRKKISNALKLFGGILVAIIVVVFGFNSAFSGVGLVAGIGLGVIIGCIPYIIGTSIGIKAVSEYGAPFSKREKEYLLISDGELEFGFQNVDNKYKESMDIYSISACAINAINVNGDVLTLIGEGKLTSYDDIISKRINLSNSQRKFYDNTPFSILLAFDERDEIVNCIKRMKER